MSSDCIFCNLISGKYSCSVLHETALSFSFLDISPLNPGHALVLPKRHCKDFLELTTEELADIAYVSQLVGRALLSSSILSPQPVGLNLVQNIGSNAGQTVFHAHQHVIPRALNDGLFNSWPGKSYPSDVNKQMIQDGVRSQIKKILDEKPTNESK